MDVVFLDANVLFSAAYRSHSGLRGLWDLEEVELVSSVYAVEEARRNLVEEVQRQRLSDLLRALKIVPEVYPPILGSAIGGRATHLLTGDVTHFGHLFGKAIGGVMILKPNQYHRRRLGEGRPGE